MSDDEETHSGDEETDAEAKTLIKSKIAAEHGNLDEVAKEILEANAEERMKMEQEIKEMRKKSEARKKEREMEEKRLAQERSAEDARRKAEEEDRKRKKEEEEQKKREARAKKTAEYEMMKNPPKRNFVISKKADTGEEEEKEESADAVAGDKKSKEQLEAEKRAILAQRIQPLNIDGFDSSRLAEKAKELHALLSRLESEKYDLEKRFKGQQFDMLELAEKARNMNKVGRGGLKRVDNAGSESDKITERFASAPPRVVMYSEFERQKDKRSYGDRRDLYVGPQFGYPAERIKPTKQLTWGEDGLPTYT